MVSRNVMVERDNNKKAVQLYPKQTLKEHGCELFAAKVYDILTLWIFRELART